MSKIPADVILNAGTWGAAAPGTGYFKVVTSKIEGDQKNPTSRRIHTSFPNGFEHTAGWLHTPFDDNGKLYPGFFSQDAAGNWVPADNRAQTRYRGLLARVNDFRKAHGITDEEIRAAGSFDLHACTGRSAFVEWHAAGDTGAEYGEIVRYLTPEQYEAVRDTKPAVALADETAAAAPGGSTAAQTPPPPSALPGVPASASGHPASSTLRVNLPGLPQPTTPSAPPPSATSSARSIIPPMPR